MTDDLQKLINDARTAQMTPEQREEQRISFAYGNANLHDPNITREDVLFAAASRMCLEDEVDRKLRREDMEEESLRRRSRADC